MSTVDYIEKAVKWAESVAADVRYGYDQVYRWGPDYDCSSFIISAWEAAGVKVKEAGATYTKNMKEAFLKCGFKNIKNSVNCTSGAGLKRGDVLLNEENHVEMYIGNGKCVKASINENWKVSGGKSGDQTGHEICTGPYYDYPWDCVLRYGADTPSIPVSAYDTLSAVDKTAVNNLPILYSGSEGMFVKVLQALLCLVFDSRLDIDGEFGPLTKAEVMTYQRNQAIGVDGVVGKKTWAQLLTDL